MKRLDMREHTRRATADICGILLSEYGIVPSFDAVERIATVVDREMLDFGCTVRGTTINQWESIAKREVLTIGQDQQEQPND